MSLQHLQQSSRGTRAVPTLIALLPLGTHAALAAEPHTWIKTFDLSPPRLWDPTNLQCCVAPIRQRSTGVSNARSHVIFRGKSEEQHLPVNTISTAWWIKYPEATEAIIIIDHLTEVNPTKWLCANWLFLIIIILFLMKFRLQCNCCGGERGYQTLDWTN